MQEKRWAHTRVRQAFGNSYRRPTQRGGIWAGGTCLNAQNMMDLARGSRFPRGKSCVGAKSHAIARFGAFDKVQVLMSLQEPLNNAYTVKSRGIQHVMHRIMFFPSL